MYFIYTVYLLFEFKSVFKRIIYLTETGTYVVKNRYRQFNDYSTYRQFQSAY